MSSRRQWISWALLVVLASAAAPCQSGRKSDVINSPHNLSVSGPGPVTSSQEDVCIFCHTPHGSLVNTPPLWNHQLSIQTYQTYASTTLNASMQQPSAAGSSKLCLSCHDGTVALGQTVSAGLIPTTGSMGATKILGSDLQNDHPVPFVPINDGQLVPSLFQTPPTTADPTVRLEGGRLECVSCHDAHTPNNDLVVRKFLVRSNQNGAICLACHDPSRPQPNQLNGWPTGSHSTAANTAPTVSPSFASYGSVAANACLNCHLPHNAPAGAGPRLLRGVEENACSQCHTGANLNPTIRNVLGEFSKPFPHPTLLVAGVHDAGEATFPLNGSRHAECMDCHNTHAAASTGGSTVPPGVQSPLLGASGVDAATGISPRIPAANQYEICFKCHANSAGKPQATPGYSAYGRTPVRQANQAATDPYNTRLELNSTLARHPVTNPRQRTAAQSPSVRAAMLNLNGSLGRSMAAGTFLYCTDCHNNDQARASAGTGPNGPHGSIWNHLLERRYELEPLPSTPGASSSGVPYVPGLTGTYALCYKCHDIDNSILNDVSFREHRQHVRGADASCATCHDPHGINGGNATNNFSLVNFDIGVVGPSSSGQLGFERTGTFAGRCYLRCHGKDHTPRSY